MVRDVRVPLSTERRASLLVLAGVVVLLLTLVMVLGPLHQRSFLEVEQVETRAQVTRVANYLGSLERLLGSSVRDWAFWTETWSYLQGDAPEYESSYLREHQAYEALAVDGLILTDLAGRIVFSGWRKAGRLVFGVAPTVGCLPPQRDERLPGPEDVLSGLCGTPLGTFLVASAPVLHNDESGPAAGWLMLSRRVDAGSFEELLGATEAEAVLYRGDRTASPDVGRALRLLAPGRTVVLPRSAERVAGYARLPDLTGPRDFVLRVETPRATVREGRAARDYMLAVMVVLGILLGGTISLLLGRVLRTEREQRRLANLHHAFLEQTQEGVLQVAMPGLRVVSANEAAAKLLGVAREALEKGTLDVLLDFRASAAEEMGRTPATVAREVMYRHPDGRLMFLELSWARVVERRTSSFLVVMRDATARHDQEQERIRYFAFYDSLTELPNRLLSRDRLEMALAHAQRHGQRVGLLSLDLDHFKVINDTLGHDLGDRLLVDVARRLEGCVRISDTVGRNGGDEFVIVLPGLTDLDGLITVAERVVRAMHDPFVFEGHERSISVSLGAATFPDSADDGDGLLRAADLAMYQAKEGGRDGYRVFEEGMENRLHDLVDLRRRLLDAIESDALTLHYQPIVCTRTGRLDTLEALVRWQREDGTLVPPGEFIPAAEATGAIVPLGEWVVNAACRQLRAWRDAGLEAPRVSVNVSPVQLNRPGLVEAVVGALTRHRLEPLDLCLEITESAAADEERALAVLTRLHELGVRIALDDFGTGFSSLAALRRLPIDTVKIDRRFVMQAEAGGGQALLLSIIKLVQQLGLRAVAEGVETAAQRAALLNAADALQGYGLARPTPAEAVPRLLTRRNHLLGLPDDAGPGRASSPPPAAGRV
jgi:diguanylate cyclase (GGDEF)-like protein/PAS domain S-box-containing protein